jgi:cell division protein FtsQ
MPANEDDTGAEEKDQPTPYMRRSRAVAVRRGGLRGGLRRLARWLFLAFLALLPLSAGGYMLARYAVNSPSLEMNSPDDVTLEGNHYVSREEILNALGVPVRHSGSGINIFRMSLRSQERQVQAIPWIRSATIVRSYPHHLAVYVAEREPVAFASVGGQIKMVDQNGVLLDTPDKGHFDFPILRGLDAHADPRGRKAQVDLYREFMRETSDQVSRSGWIVSEVNVSDPDDLQALLVQGPQTLLVHFGSQNFLARFENFLTILPELRNANSPIDSVDLRYNNQVVVNPDEQGSGASQAPK